MKDFEKELKDYGLYYRESDHPDRKAIDFSIDDGEDNVCWVWGNSADDIEWECDHPAVEYDDDESVGECVVCGATCDWHWDISADDGYIVKDRVPYCWHRADKVGGLIKKYIK